MGELAQAAVMHKLAPAQNKQIQFFDDAGNEIVISSNDVAKFICPKATEKEILFFMELCRAQRLNPFLNEAFLVKYDKNAQMITAETVLERRANAHPDFRGIKSGVVYLDANGAVCKREGSAAYAEAGETLIGGWANVEREGRTDTYAEITLKEYSKNQSTWKTMPGTMINKCARAAALRKAFPVEFEGLYIKDELRTVPTVEAMASNIETSELTGAIMALADLRGVGTQTVVDALANHARMNATGYTGGAMTDAQTGVALEIVNEWLLKAQNLPVEAEEAQAVNIDAETIEEADSGENMTAQAVCKTCGNVVFVTPDATAQDIAFQCCEAPNYEIQAR